MEYKGVKIKTNSTEYKILQKKKYLQRLIDIPYEEWEDYDHWYNNNKPHYITKQILLDIIENEVVIMFDETFKKVDKEKYLWLMEK